MSSILHIISFIYNCFFSLEMLDKFHLFHRVTPQTKIFANFSQKSNFLGNYQSDRQTLKTNSPYFLTLFKIVDNHFLIRPTHCAQIEKNDPLKWPNDPFLRLRHPVTPKIQLLEKKFCGIKYSYTLKEQNM